MEMATLGKTGLQVSRLGAGLAEIGNLALSDADEAGRVLNTALDGGINFLDTAECYLISEELIGRTVAHRRSEYVLATKAGHVSGGYAGENWTGRTVADSIDRSLVRMKTDYLDLVQLHAYDLDGPPRDDVLEALMAAKDAGKTRFVGYSADNQHARWAIESGLFDTLQTVFSLLDQHARTRVFGLAEDKGVGIIVKRPIAAGMWGVDGVSRDYSGNDRLVKVLLPRGQAIAKMGPIPGAPDDRILLALGFVLAHPEVNSAIVGTRNPSHMASNIRMVENELPIPMEAVEELHRRYDLLGDDWLQVDTFQTQVEALAGPKVGGRTSS